MWRLRSNGSQSVAGRPPTTTAPVVRLEETVDQLEDGALAGAAPPDERQCFSGLDGQVEPSQHVRLAPLESNTAERDLGHE